MPIKFSPRTAQYIDTDTGRFVPRATVLATVEEEITKFQSRLTKIVNRYNRGQINLAQFQAEMMGQIKTSLIQSASIASGGKKRLDRSTKRALQARLRNRFGYLRNFAQEIEKGELTPGEIANRTRSYAEAYRATFYDAEKRMRKDLAFNQAARWLDPSAQHCDDCLRHTTNGKWKPIDEVVSPGNNCKCHGRCRCFIRYRRFVDSATAKRLLTPRLGG